MANSHGNRRRKVIVDPGAQGPMMARWVVLPVFVLAIGATAMLWVAYETFNELERLGGSAPPFSGLVVSTVLLVVGVSTMVTWLAAQQSHRISGPARKLEQSIERIRNGDLGFEVTLRERDELTAVADQLNLLLAAMRDRAAVDEADVVAAETREAESIASA